MDRFNFEEPDEFDGEYVYGEDEEMVPGGTMFLMYPQQGQPSELVQMAQTGMIITELNQKLLLITLQILEKSWFWRFRSQAKKLELIQKTYDHLNQIMDQTYQEE